MAINRSLLGDEHEAVGGLLYRLARVLVDKGDEAGVETLVQDGRALYDLALTLPEDHPHRSGAPLLLGELLLARGDAQAAEPLLRESVAVRNATLPEDHWLTHYAQSTLGECLTRLDRLDEAERLLVEAYPIIEASGFIHKKGVRYYYTQLALRRIIHLHEAWGRPEMAAQWRAKLPAEEAVGEE